ncbi:uncharacterized protein LOC135330632 isoform X2 [Dromaius novaehollandiae]|uniref:uncharacterized protein LOC135330632 isoform X2 n=1 Tax=Dromaius novaehollandiae TaxID=8790 RepID=UPI00311DB03C
MRRELPGEFKCQQKGSPPGPDEEASATGRSAASLPDSRDAVLRASNSKGCSSALFVDFGDAVLRKHVPKPSRAVEGALSQLGALRRCAAGHGE